MRFSPMVFYLMIFISPVLFSNTCNSDEDCGKIDRKNFVEIATINDEKPLEVGMIVYNILTKEEVRVIIEGSLIYSIMVEKEVAKKSTIALQKSKDLKGRGIKIINAINAY